MVGKQVGQYHILEEIGGGGMGVVYKAEDKKLRRLVALKFLPDRFAGDPQYLERFRREAYAASALNHPHICTIYDIDVFENRPFIVMEFIDGRTLTKRIGGQPMPLDLLLSLATQIAETLDAAHSKGIIHRDIKPANILVTDRNHVKIVDFGLAKLAPEAHRATSDATVPMQSSGQHILGTPWYMSPEQARGESVDARSDLFSFGLVLYEMATGKNPRDAVTLPFAAEAPRRVWSSIRRSSSSLMHPGLEAIIRKALQSELEKRYSSASEMHKELSALQYEVAGRRAWNPFIVIARWTAALLAIFAFAAALWLWVPRWLPKDRSLPPPAFVQLTTQRGVELFPNLSPDGRFLIYAAHTAGNWDIFLQRAGGQNATNLTPDSAADDTQPAISPDGNFIAFRSERDGGGIYVMGATGESPRRVTDFGYNPSWSPDGTQLVFATESVVADPNERAGLNSRGGSLWKVNITSGNPVQIRKDDAVQPAWSPHGNRIAFWANIGGQRDIWTVRSDGSDLIQVTNDAALDWSPVWSPDGAYIYFSSDQGEISNLWRIPVAETTGKVLGLAEPVTTGAGTSLRTHPSISRDGRNIAYVESQTINDSIQKVAFDPKTARTAGIADWLTQDHRPARNPDPSPDGKWIAYASWGQQEDIYLIRPDGSEQRQLTNDAYKDRVPRWSPDGKRIAFFSNRTGSFEIWTIRPDGSGLNRVTYYGSEQVLRAVWSPDGRRMASYSPKQGAAILDLDSNGSLQAEHPLPAPGGAEAAFNVWSWSPNGRWLAGARSSISSGAKLGISLFEVETQQYEHLTDFGGLPVWLPDNQRLLFDWRGVLYLVDRRTKRTEQILSMPPHTIYSPGQLSADGRWLYFGLLTREADVWLMKQQ